MVETTGLRNPCTQLDGFRPGLMAAVLGRDEHGGLVRKASVIGVVLAGGEVRPDDPIRVRLPPEPNDCFDGFEMRRVRNLATRCPRT